MSIDKKVKHFHKLIGENVKRIREEKGFSQRALSLAIGQESTSIISQAELGNYEGLTFQQIQKYEKGMNRIGSGRLYRFAKMLKIPVTYFYEGIEGATGDGDNGGEKTASDIENEKKEKDLQKLSEHFLSIEDGRVRKSVINLIKSLNEKR